MNGRFAYCYRLVNAISFSLPQSNHIKQLPLYYYSVDCNILAISGKGFTTFTNLEQLFMFKIAKNVGIKILNLNQETNLQ